MSCLTHSLTTAIPADCRVNNSEIDVDQAALTGESLPVTFYKGDSCKMGSTVVRGEVEATVEFTGIDTFFGKTASLLASTGEVSHLQKVLMSFMMILVFLSVTLCLISFIYLLVEGVPVKEALSHVSLFHTLAQWNYLRCTDHSNANYPFL
jgi:H+-transporting ATPase